MSKSATVSKLESLLARIRGRASEPRQTTHAPAPVASGAVPVAAAPAPVAAIPPPVAAAPPPAPVPADARAASRSEAPVSAQMIAVEEATLPPPPMTNDADFDVDVEVGGATSPPPPMAEPPAEGAPVHAPLESRERLASVPSVPPRSEPPEVAPDMADDGPSLEQSEALAEEDALAGEEVDDQREDAPASSRRPVAPPPEERLAAIAFGAVEPQPPRHTPPPKSGRLPAPPSEFDADETGVREAVAISTHDDDATQPSAQIGRPAALAAQAARPNLGATPARVADVIGSAQSFAPTTFLALLDASLSL